MKKHFNRPFEELVSHADGRVDQALGAYAAVRFKVCLYLSEEGLSLRGNPEIVDEAVLDLVEACNTRARLDLTIDPSDSLAWVAMARSGVKRAARRGDKAWQGGGQPNILGSSEGAQQLQRELYEDMQARRARLDAEADAIAGEWYVGGFPEDEERN